jgi:hypothetical protein
MSKLAIHAGYIIGTGFDCGWGADGAQHVNSVDKHCSGYHFSEARMIFQGIDVMYTARAYRLYFVLVKFTK